jgi:histidinol dehydrogenase
MTGALPPSSRCTRFTVVAADPATSIPARTLPVTDTIAGTGCATRARPVSRSPQTTLNTPGGRCSAISSAIMSAVTGVVSAGLSTMVFPAARAGAHFHTAIISG